MVQVMVVRSGAARPDDLTDQDYADIYREIRDKMSLRQFVELVHSAYSIAFWSKYEANKGTLNRQARQELRRAVGLAPLDPSVGEALETVKGDATVYRVGAGQPDRVVLVGEDEHGVLMRLNGRLDVLEQPEPVTRLQRPRDLGRISLARPTWERLNAVRAARGLSWSEFLEPLLIDEQAEN